MTGHVITIEYLHRSEYRTRKEDGTWTEWVYRYANSTPNEATAYWRHTFFCKDVEFIWNSKFEGIWGYAYRNCVLVRRITTTTTSEEVLT